MILEEKVEHSFKLAEHFERAVQASGGKFVLVQPRSYVNVCFWWIPTPMRPFSVKSANPNELDVLAEVDPSPRLEHYEREICTEQYQQGANSQRSMRPSLAQQNRATAAALQVCCKFF